MSKFSQFFKDSKGNIVIGQWPNWPLWLAFGFYVLTVLPVPQLDQIGTWGLPITLLYWSYLELTSGVNGFRRVLGLVVGLLQLQTIYGLLK